MSCKASAQGRNPITGAVVVADVVPTPHGGDDRGNEIDLIKREILEACRVSCWRLPARQPLARDRRRSGRCTVRQAAAPQCVTWSRTGVHPAVWGSESYPPRRRGLSCDRGRAGAESAQLATASQGLGSERQGSIRLRALDLAEIDAIPPLVKGIREEFGSIYGLAQQRGIGTGGLLASMRMNRSSDSSASTPTSPLIPPGTSKWMI